MERFIPGKVKSNKMKFDEGRLILREKRDSWDERSQEWISYLNKVKTECEVQGMFESVYVIDSRNSHHSKGLLPHITLFFGQKPLGYVAAGSGNMASEKGCSLVISQSVFGDVICIYYPYESELANVSEKYLVANVYRAPWELTDLALDKVVDNFFSYAQVSSIYGCPTCFDRLNVLSMRLYHWWLHLKVGDALLKIIGKAAEASLKQAMRGHS